MSRTLEEPALCFSIQCTCHFSTYYSPKCHFGVKIHNRKCPLCEHLFLLNRVKNVTVFRFTAVRQICRHGVVLSVECIPKQAPFGPTLLVGGIDCIKYLIFWPTYEPSVLIRTYKTQVLKYSKIYFPLSRFVFTRCYRILSKVLLQFVLKCGKPHALFCRLKALSDRLPAKLIYR